MTRARAAPGVARRRRRRFAAGGRGGRACQLQPARVAEARTACPRTSRRPWPRRRTAISGSAPAAGSCGSTACASRCSTATSSRPSARTASMRCSPPGTGRCGPARRAAACPLSRRASSAASAPPRDSATVSFASIFEDRAGRLWVGTDDGLFRMHEEPLPAWTAAAASPRSTSTPSAKTGRAGCSSGARACSCSTSGRAASLPVGGEPRRQQHPDPARDRGRRRLDRHDLRPAAAAAGPARRSLRGSPHDRRVNIARAAAGPDGRAVDRQLRPRRAAPAGGPAGRVAGAARAPSRQRAGDLRGPGGQRLGGDAGRPAAPDPLRRRRPSPPPTARP